MGVKRYPEDIAFSNTIRESYDYECCHCGENHRHNPGFIHCAHVHTRKHRSTRWCPTYGAVALCARCHRRFTDYPVEWAEFLRGYLGDSNYDEAKRKAWEVRKFTKAERKEIAKHYREELKRIESLRAGGQRGHIPVIGYE